MEFELTTVDLGDGAFCIEVVGEADLATASELKAALTEALDSGARWLLVDFSATSFIDSTALGVLMGAVKRLRSIEGDLALVCVDPNICKLFQMTLLDRVFDISDTKQAALERLAERRRQAPALAEPS